MLRRLIPLLTASLLLAGFAPRPGLTASAPGPQGGRLLAPAAAVQAFSITEMTGSGDVVLRGINPSFDVFVPVPEQWRITGAVFRITYTHSEVLDPLSTLTVEIADTPVASINLTPDNIGPATWDVEIPPELLTGEAIALSVVGYLRITDDICDDLENVANWARLAATSTMEFTYDEQNFQPELAKFPYPFIRTRSLTVDSTVVVVPSAPTGTELAPAMYVAGALGAQSTWRGLNLYTLTPEELTEATRTEYDLVLVGRADRLSVLNEVTGWPLAFAADGSFADPSGQAVAPDTGVIMLAPSPWNGTHGVMAVTGKTDTAVTNAARALQSPEFSKLARGAYALVPSAPDSSQFVAGPVDWNRASLADLGYPDQTVRGLGKHTLTYVLDLPNSRVPESLNVTVAFSHSPFVTTDRSYLTLSVNGVPQAGTYLTKDNEQEGVWDATVPGSQLRPGRNTIEFLYDLHLADFEACDDLYLDRAWGVIQSATTFSVKFSDASPAADLTTFPVPFDAGSLIVLPTQPGPNERAGAFRLFTELGVQMGIRAQGLNIVTADQVSEDSLRSQNVILFGQPGSNNWVATALQSAPVKFDGQVRSLDTRLLKLSLADGESVGLLEVLESPWDGRRTAMVITGTDDQGVGWASNLLVDPKSRGQLKGDVAVVDSRGFLTTIDSRQPAGTSSTEATPVSAATRGFSIVQYVLLAVLVIAALALIVVLLRRRRA